MVGMSPLDMGPGIQWDMVGKQAVCILLECFLVSNACAMHQSHTVHEALNCNYKLQLILYFCSYHY